MIEQTKNSLVICGPTACGKTRLAVKAAYYSNGEIISADSRQVYIGMDIGTGKDLSEYVFNNQKINYYCIDIAKPDELYSLYRYIIDFNKAFNEILRKGKFPVIAGGTGLYLEAVLKKYNVSEVPENREFRDKMMAMDTGYLRELLRTENAGLYERTDLTSKKRIVRSLEISRFDNSTSVADLAEHVDIKPLIAVIVFSKDEINDRIDLRLEQRLDSGMVKEVEDLINNGLSRERLRLFGMEYSCISRYIFGEQSYAEMVENLRNEIHRLAKRQLTWFRGMERRGLSVVWIDNNHDEALFSLLRSNKIV